MLAYPPKDSVLLNVCIIPEASVGKECVTLSRGLKSEDTLFVLDGETKFAHMTLYMARFPESAIPSVVAGVKDVLAGTTRISCTHSGYFMTAGRYLEVSYEKTQEFLDLQSALVEKLKGYRSTLGEPYEESYYAPYTDEQRKNVRETGYDLVGDLYRPHITLTRYREGMMPESIPEFPSSDLSFSLSTIGVYIADDNGAVYEQLGVFNIM